MRTEAAAQGELLQLLPDGWAFARAVDSFTAALLLPWGAELVLVEQSMEAMLPEVDPRAADNLLPDYERVLGPDPCGRDLLPLSDADRRALAYQRWTAGGNICAGYFISQAAAIGVSMTIEDFTVSQCGLMQCGDMLVNDPSQFGFQVSLTTNRVIYFECGDAEAGDALGDYAPSLMQCVVAKEAPAQLVPYFSYTD